MPKINLIDIKWNRNEESSFCKKYKKRLKSFFQRKQK